MGLEPEKNDEFDPHMATNLQIELVKTPNMW